VSNQSSLCWFHCIARSQRNLSVWIWCSFSGIILKQQIMLNCPFLVMRNRLLLYQTTWHCVFTI